VDLAGVIVTADALHTQREHVDYLASRGAHWVLTVKGNQPNLRKQLAGLPWRQVEIGPRSAETSHGRREIRSVKVVTIAVGILFPHAAQAIQLTRKTRPVSGRGRWHTEIVYAITDLPPHQAGPDELATRSVDIGRSRTPCTGSATSPWCGSLPDPRRRRTTGHGYLPQPRDQPSPAGRGSQHRRRATPSRS
jgi:hypothetical protein